MQTLEGIKVNSPDISPESQEKVKISTAEKLRKLRQKTIQSLKIAGVGLAGLYLGANALKPQIVESILSNTYEHSTSETLKKFTESDNKLAASENESNYKTFTISEGEKVRYIEYTQSRTNFYNE
jgi:hypothetical protein